jgi:predicted nucleotidyltransferase component of viral defense system
VLSRALCELYQDSFLSKNLVFRGGTALHKLFFERAGRFSEDLDFVQAKAEPIGEVVDAIHLKLDPWLGKPSWKQGQGRFTLSYRFQTEIEPVVKRKVKIEINTREHNNYEPYLKVPFSVNNRWFQGEVDVFTYSMEELLATKLRALYQRKKGRDLYDFWYTVQELGSLDITKLVDIFQRYMRAENTQVSRAEFERNLVMKKGSDVFNSDVNPLLTQDQLNRYQLEEAYSLLFDEFLPKLGGESWKKLIKHSQAKAKAKNKCSS